MISHKRTDKSTSQKYTCIHYKYTKSDHSRQQKQNTCIIFGYFRSFLLSSKIRLVVNVQIYYKKHVKTRLEIGRGQVYIYNLFIFSPYRHSSSTQLTRHKIHSDTPKSFDPHLRTKPNYSLPKLTLKNHNKTAQFHIISHLPHLTTLLHPSPNKFNTNKQNIT